VLKVVLQPQLSSSNHRLPRSDDFLRQAQRDLLQKLKDKQQEVPLSLDEGAAELQAAFAGSGSVLLLVDNVPEDGEWHQGHAATPGQVHGPRVGGMGRLV